MQPFDHAQDRISFMAFLHKVVNGHMLCNHLHVRKTCCANGWQCLLDVLKATLWPLSYAKKQDDAKELYNQLFEKWQHPIFKFIPDKHWMSIDNLSAYADKLLVERFERFVNSKTNSRRTEMMHLAVDFLWQGDNYRNPCLMRHPGQQDIVNSLMCTQKTSLFQ